MLERDDNALKSYKRLRPSWKQMANVASRVIVGRIDENGLRFVGDGFWLLINAILPDEARRIMENKSRWSGGGILNAPETLKEHNATLYGQATSTNSVVAVEPITVRTGVNGKISAWGQDSILVFRIEDRDIGVNPRKARWVEKHGKDEGAWYAEPQRHDAPLRYIVRDHVVGDRVIGLLSPYRLGAVGNWEGWGIEWDEKTRRYYEEGE